MESFGAIAASGFVGGNREDAVSGLPPKAGQMIILSKVNLRHNFNTNMVKAGVNKAVIMKLTGHKTLSMFLRYSHLDKEQSESAMESLSALLAVKREKALG